MRDNLLKYLPFVIVLVAWEVGARSGLLNPVFFSSPSGVIAGIADWFGTGKILRHLGWTLGEILTGMVLSFVIGVPLGILIGWYRPFGDMWNPTLFFLDAVPVIGVAPALPLVVGLGPWTAVILVIFLTIMPTILSVAAGVRTVSPDLLRMGRHFGARDGQLFRSIILPFVGPYIFGALRGNIGRALAGVLVGEWLGSSVGLGSMMFDAAGVFEVISVYVGALTVVAISLVFSALIALAERRTTQWREA